MLNTSKHFAHDDLQRMSHIMRHRLRNIAAGISGAVNLIASDSEVTLSPDLREYFPLVLRECESLTEIANRLSLYWEPVTESKPESADSLTTRVAAGLSRKFPHVEFQQQGSVQCSIPSLIEIALNEVMLNACEAAPYGTVCITTSQVQDSVFWKISDSGDGVQETDRDRVFQPFFTTRPRHLGLGLALARAYAAKIGGSCEPLAGTAPAWTIALQCPTLTSPDHVNTEGTV